ncbi:hypothetical protein [Phenylobacterium montanum]|uniref:DUF2188 domain-containing protein n=1 Tax=Phenylobacterium montanum TaxID=2823693 RepID=A0A975FX68_9CAUL|nr:hypothetical protein [Caulobacter sp. S6]QUD86899.1 hypothetical protein KCG34_17730 [Caulobacter sp. S6]
MITFRVVKEEHGWSVRTGEQMCTPFWAKESAVREAKRMADAIRSHGTCAEVLVEGLAPGDQPRLIRGASVARLAAILNNQR